MPVFHIIYRELHMKYEPRYEKTGLQGFRPGPTQTRLYNHMTRGLKFHVLEEEGLYYPCSRNKGADQLGGYLEADLCLCFRICKKLVFS